MSMASKHNAVTNHYRRGYQAVCLTNGCGWRGPLREPSPIARADIANAKARDAADEDAERHDDEEDDGRR